MTTRVYFLVGIHLVKGTRKKEHYVTWYSNDKKQPIIHSLCNIRNRKIYSPSAFHWLHNPYMYCEFVLESDGTIRPPSDSELKGYLDVEMKSDIKEFLYGITVEQSNSDYVSRIAALVNKIQCF